MKGYFFIFLIMSNSVVFSMEHGPGYLSPDFFDLGGQELDETELSDIFDGRGFNFQTDKAVAVNIYGGGNRELSYSKSRVRNGNPFIPEPSAERVFTESPGAVGKGFFTDSPLSSEESKICAEARLWIKIYNKDLSDATRDVVVFWDKTDESDVYAEALTPGFLGNPRKIRLNPAKKELLMKSPVLLAIILVHEFSHEEDYKTINGGFGKNSAERYISEEKAYLTQIRMYRYLKHMLPEPQAEERELGIFLKEQEFLTAIWQFKHGGRRPDLNDYSSLVGYKNTPIERLIRRLDKGTNGVYSFNEFLGVGYGFTKFVSGSGKYKKIRAEAVKMYREYSKLYEPCSGANSGYCIRPAGNPDEFHAPSQPGQNNTGNAPHNGDNSSQAEDVNEESSQGGGGYPGSDVNQPNPDISDNPNWDGAW
ncbi:MAG: hypothetical protein COT17_02770 [Elusimicrobia bacterium CG08_land_8_20_14_0_20_51_18]|nr:MAG: hypothetical protein COT17_02770 [Elusimicrobia bacterium CG08_land_8_20_14_0_20_51_18]